MNEWKGQGGGFRDITRKLDRLNIRTPHDTRCYASTVIIQLATSGEGISRIEGVVPNRLAR
jgi:hypothetical protein